MERGEASSLQAAGNRLDFFFNSGFLKLHVLRDSVSWLLLKWEWLHCPEQVLGYEAEKAV